jgi:methylmalonyl-CoA/ethylmalonyl-CoA epimerase
MTSVSCYRESMSLASSMGVQASLDHAAHAVTSLRDVIPLYRDQLGGSFLYGGDNTHLGFRAVTFGYGSSGKVELLEPLGASDFLTSFFKRHPLGGLHHLTFRVHDLRAAVERAIDAGYDIIGEDVSESRWKQAFIHPRSGCGALVQFVEAPDDYPPRVPGQTLESVLDGRGLRAS